MISLYTITHEYIDIMIFQFLFAKIHDILIENYSAMQNNLEPNYWFTSGNALISCVTEAVNGFDTSS